MDSWAHAQRSVLPDLPPDLAGLRAQLGLTQAELANAFGVAAKTWARWEHGTLILRPAYQVLLDLVEHKADQDAERVAARLRAPGGLRNLW